MNSLDEVNKQMDALRRERDRLAGANFREKLVPQLRAVKGRTFVYRDNTYGDGGKWDVYRKVLAVSLSEDHAYLLVEDCQIDSHGKARLESDSEFISPEEKSALPHLDRGWSTCSADEYESARAAVLTELQKPAKLQSYLERGRTEKE